MGRIGRQSLLRSAYVSLYVSVVRSSLFSSRPVMFCRH